MGGFSCPICYEQLHQLPAEALKTNRYSSRKDAAISRTPCSHIFHTYCIKKWQTGFLKSSKHCPCCRKVIPGSKVFPLYPNGDGSVGDCEESLPQADHSQCRKTRRSLERELVAVQDELKGSKISEGVLREELQDLRKKYVGEKVRAERVNDLLTMMEDKGKDKAVTHGLKTAYVDMGRPCSFL